VRRATLLTRLAGSRLLPIRLKRPRFSAQGRFVKILDFRAEARTSQKGAESGVAARLKTLFDSYVKSLSGGRGYRSSQLPFALLLQPRGAEPHTPRFCGITQFPPSHIVVRTDSCWAVQLWLTGACAYCRAIEARSARLYACWAYPGELRTSTVTSVSGRLLIILPYSFL